MYTYNTVIVLSPDCLNPSGALKVAHALPRAVCCRNHGRSRRELITCGTVQHAEQWMRHETDGQQFSSGCRNSTAKEVDWALSSAQRTLLSRQCCGLEVRSCAVLPSCVCMRISTSMNKSPTQPGMANVVKGSGWQKLSRPGQRRTIKAAQRPTSGKAYHGRTGSRIRDL